MNVALTIAGSDSSGGAGIQADLKTFQALGVFGMSAVTAVTVQDTRKVYAIQEVEPELVRDQILCLFDDAKIHAVKIGMVGSIPLIHAIREALDQVERPKIVLDPVMISKSGYPLMAENAREALIENLVPLADVITPNLPEAEVLVGKKVDCMEAMENAARILVENGAGAAVIKGGHLDGCEDATDLFFDGSNRERFTSPRFRTKNTHGTGCTFSSAIAAHLARGFSMVEAAREAKIYVSGAIRHALDIGKGHGPTHHFHALYEKAGMNR